MIRSEHNNPEGLSREISLLDSAIETVTDSVAIFDVNENICGFNQNFLKTWEISAEDAASSDADSLLERLTPLMEEPVAFFLEIRNSLGRSEINEQAVWDLKDGRKCEFYCRPQVVDGKNIGTVWTCRDISKPGSSAPGDVSEPARNDDLSASCDASTALSFNEGEDSNLQISELAFSETDRKLSHLLENMSEGLLEVDLNDVIVFANKRFCEMSGYDRTEMLGRTAFDLFFTDEDRAVTTEANELRQKGIPGHHEATLRTKSGVIMNVLIGGTPIFDANGEFCGSMSVFTDITERKIAEERLLYDAFHDPLTGLSNRSLFMEHLQLTIKRCRRGKKNLFAVLFLDFDRFKVINDSLGHAAGDLLLKQIAERLEAGLRPGDLVARLGGDEFTVLLNGLPSEQSAFLLAERLQEDLKRPFDLDGREIFTSASIGIAFSAPGTSAAEMLRDADIAMYRAKSAGKARFQVFDKEMHDEAIMRLQLETELRQAIERREFRVYYQPIIDIETGSLTGFEALIRWDHPQRGLISPMEFIPAAEENSMILAIGKWVLYESCWQMREWQRIIPAANNLKLNVNLSVKEFLQYDLAEQITGTLIKTGLNPGCLKLEITESHVMENTEAAVAMMDRLRQRGVEMSLDDFGTGYSSLSYLHKLPVSSLKIDRSFIGRMTDSDENREIVNTIIRLARNLKMSVIAEGIETSEQLEQLKELGCEYGQGYYFSRPLDPARARLLIEGTNENQIVPVVQDVFTLEGNM